MSWYTRVAPKEPQEPARDYSPEIKKAQEDAKHRFVTVGNGLVLLYVVLSVAPWAYQVVTPRLSSGCSKLLGSPGRHVPQGGAVYEDDQPHHEEDLPFWMPHPWAQRVLQGGSTASAAGGDAVDAEAGALFAAGVPPEELRKAGFAVEQPSRRRLEAQLGVSDRGPAQAPARATEAVAVRWSCSADPPWSREQLAYCCRYFGMCSEPVVPPLPAEAHCEVRPHSTWQLCCLAALVLLTKVLSLNPCPPAAARAGFAGRVETVLSLLNFVVPLFLLAAPLWQRFRIHFTAGQLTAMRTHTGQWALVLDGDEGDDVAQAIASGQVPPVCMLFDSYDEVLSASQFYFGGLHLLLFSLGALCLVLGDLVKLRSTSACLLLRLAGTQDMTSWRHMKGFDAFPKEDQTTRAFSSLREAKAACIAGGFGGFAVRKSRGVVHYRSHTASELFAAVEPNGEVELFVVPGLQEPTLYRRVMFRIFRICSCTQDTLGSPFVQDLKNLEKKLVGDNDAAKTVEQICAKRIGVLEACKLVFQRDRNEACWTMLFSAIAFTLCMPLEFVHISPCLSFGMVNAHYPVFGILRFTDGNTYLWALRFGAALFCGALFGLNLFYHCRSDAFCQSYCQKPVRPLGCQLFRAGVLYALLFGTVTSLQAISNFSFQGLLTDIVFSRALWKDVLFGPATGASNLLEKAARRLSASCDGVVPGAYDRFFRILSGIGAGDAEQLLLAWTAVNVLYRQVLLALHRRLDAAPVVPTLQEAGSVVGALKQTALHQGGALFADALGNKPGEQKQQLIAGAILAEKQKVEVGSVAEIHDDENLQTIGSATAGSRKAYGYQTVLRDFCLLSLAADVLVVFIPFGFEYTAWYKSQVFGWSAQTSNADWLCVTMVRDAAATYYLSRAKAMPDAARWRRLTVAALIVAGIFGLCRLWLLDWRLPCTTELFAPLIGLEVLKPAVMAYLFLGSADVLQGLPQAAGQSSTGNWTTVAKGDASAAGPCTHCGTHLAENGGWRCTVGTQRLCHDCVVDHAGRTYPPEPDVPAAQENPTPTQTHMWSRRCT